MADVTLRINGRSVVVELDDDDTPLLYVLRDELGLKNPSLRLWAGPERGVHRPYRRRSGSIVRSARLRRPARAHHDSAGIGHP
jgi:hypothetical protein